MFKKLVSNLPFNPGLMHQIAFYGKRLNKEKSLRRASFGFMAATLVVNILAISSPAQNTLAASLNDIVYGATSKQVILNALASGTDTAGRTDIKAIYDYYGITAGDVSAACQVNLFPSNDLQTYNTTAAPNCADPSLASFNGHLITSGRYQTAQAGNPHYANIKSAEDQAWLDRPQDIPGTGTRLYNRPLQIWGEWYTSSQVISGYASGNGLLKGKRFWILLKGCGNITFERFPIEPRVEIVKAKVTPADSLKVNDLLDYKIQYRNTGTGTASDVSIDDVLAPEFEFISQTSNDLTFTQNGQSLKWTRPLLPVTEWLDIIVKVKVRTISTPTKLVCNVASIVVAGYPPATSPNADSEKCITIDNRCPGTDIIVPEGGIEKCTYTCPDGSIVDYNKTGSCPTPLAVCEYLKIVDTSAWDKRSFEAKITLNSGAKLDSVKLLIDGKEKKDFGAISETRVLSSGSIGVSEGAYTATIQVKQKAGTTYNQGNDCSLQETITKKFTRISNSKKVKNVTQKTEYDSSTKAKAGDILEYALTVNNSGNIEQTDYVIQPDTVADILEYADISSHAGANYDQTTQKLSWPAMNIPAGGSVTKTFQVTMKSPVPTTAPSQSDPLSFDYKLTNFYGNEVTVNVDKPIPAQVQQTATKLPKTGAGSSLFITFLLVCLVGFFYTRSSILAKEIDAVRYEYSRGA